jgi:hypothetical protein
MVGVVKAFSGAGGAADSTADAETDDDSPLGSWKDGTFSFTSPQAEAQWRRVALRSGVDFQNWSQGRKLTEKTRQLAELGFLPSADIYRGPDGNYYQMTPAAREHPQITAMRSIALKSDPSKIDIGTAVQKANARITPQAMALMDQYMPISGMAPAPASKPVNDNKPSGSAANDNTKDASSVSVTDGQEESLSERPGLLSRFGAALEKGAMDGTMLGELAQELKKGKGYDPDYLAIRIPDRFMQSPELQQAWRDRWGKRKKRWKPPVTEQPALR